MLLSVILKFTNELLLLSTVVCYCSIGYRSSDVARELASHVNPVIEGGVFNMEGGVFEWVMQGRPVVCEDRETKEVVQINTVHPYSTFWGKLLPSHLRANL